jgi:hypothetical protein
MQDPLDADGLRPQPQMWRVSGTTVRKQRAPRKAERLEAALRGNWAGVYQGVEKRRLWL